MQNNDNLNKYISLQEAVKFCNYSQEYLSLRARQGKLKAVKFGRNWVTKQEWLAEYLLQVEEYNETYENSKVKKLGVVPDNLPIELIGWQKIRLPNFSRMPVSGLRSGFIAALAVSLLLNNIAFGKENFKNVFQEADNHVAQLGIASNKLLVNSKESIETVFGAANSLTASADLESISNTIITNIAKADAYTYIRDEAYSLLSDSKESFKNVFSSLGYLANELGLRTEKSLAESDQTIRNVFKDASLYAYMSGSEADEFWADAGKSLKNIFEDSTSFVNGLGDNFDKGLANNFENLAKKANGYTYIITASLGDILADSAKSIKDAKAIASSFVANLGNGFDKKLTSIAGGWQDSFVSVYDDLKKINLGLADAGDAVGKKTGENLIGYFSRLKDGYISTNKFVEEKISQGLKSAKKSVLDFGSKISNMGKFTVSPWKEGVVPDQVAVQEVEEKAKEEDVKKLEEQIKELKATPAKEIVKEVTRVTQVEPVKEITREVTKIDEFALTQVRAQIVDLQDAVAKRLYAPGGVVSQQIYITQPVSSPKVYQENGDIILQTLGSGNVVLTAATGLQISGKQIVIDSTAVSNPLVYIADKTDIAGDTSVGGTVTSQKIVINSGNSGENILDVKYNSVSKFSVTDTSSSLVGNFTITGSLTANGDQTFNGILSLSTSSASAILTVAQSGSGKIVDFKDGSVSVFTIADGGYADLAVAASTTPAFLIRMAEATSTFSTSTYLGVLATSTFAGRFADFVKSGSGSFFYLDSSGNLMATGTLTTGATTTLAVNGGYVGVGTSSPATLFTVATSTNIFNVLTNGNVGIGTVSPSSKLYLYDSLTNTGGDSLYIVSSSTVTANSTNYVRGVRFELFNQNISAGVTDSGYRMGILSDAYIENAAFAGTLASQYGIRSDVGIVNASSSAIVSNAYAGNFRVLNRIANATITNAYGVYIENSETTGAITNRYDLYASSGSAKNYFAGLVGIGTTSPAEALTVSGGLYVGTSTIVPTLYVASSTGRVAIGTSTAASLFSVATSTDIFHVLTNQGVGIGTSTVGGLLNIGTTTSGLFVNRAGFVGIGITSPTAALEINGNLTFSGNATITSAAAGNLVFDSGGGSITIASGDDLLAAGSGSDIGSSGTRFGVIYADEVNAATLVGTTTVGNTSAQTLTINSDNATNDTEDIYLAFERGTRTPNALLQWNSTSTLFDFNFGTRITNSTSTDSFVVFDEDSDSSPFVIDRSGNVAIGTSTASENLTVWGGAFFGTTSATPTFYIASSTGRVGVGTSTPSALFAVGTSTDILTVSSAGSGSVTVNTGRLIVNGAAATDQNSITSNPYRLLVDNNEVINMSSNPEFAKTSANYTSVAVSVIGRAILDSSNTKDWTRDLRAGGLSGGEFEVRIEDNSTGTVTRGTGILVKGNGEIGDGAALTNWVGIRIDPPTGAGVTAGNVENVYGLLMDDFSTGGTTNNYAIYSSAGKSYFGGNIGIATTTPDEKLTVWGGAFFGTTSATPTFYIASSTGRVAIGTSTASTLFTIATSTNIFNVTTAGGVGVGTTTAGSAWFQVASTSPGLIIDRAGQVGIGTTTLSGLFTVGTSTTGLTVMQNGYVGIGTTAPAEELDIWSATPALRLTDSTDSEITTLNYDSNRFEIYVDTASPIVSITENGNVGIATTTPDENLTVWGGAFFGTTSATPTFYIASSTGRVAIGTSTASTLFTIATSTNIFNITTAGGVGIGTTTAGSAWFQVASTSPGLIIDQAGQVGIGTTTLSGLFSVATSTFGLFVNQAGNVGIGTAGPNIGSWGGAALTIEGSSGGNLQLSRKSDSISDGNSLAVLGFFAGSASQTNVANIEALAVGTSENAADLRFLTATGGTLSEQVRILSTGQVGIGTTTPNENLTVWGGAFFGTTSATPTFYIASSTGRVAIGTSTASTLFTIATSTNIFNVTTAGGVGVGTTTAGSAWFQVASTSPGLIIDRAGQVGIGTTTLSGLFTVGTSTTGLTVLQNGSVQIGTNGLTSAGTLWSTAFSSGTTAMLSLNNVNSVYTFTDDTESIANVISAYYAATSAAYNGIAIGTVSRAILDPTNTKNWTAPQTRGGLVGLEGSARIGSNSTGTVSNVTTILAKGEGEINDGAAVTNWRQLLIETPTGAGVTAGNVANIYGLYIQSMTGAATSNYAIYSEGGSSYFGGNIGIATTTPNENLTVWGGAFFGTTSATPTFYIASSTGRVAIGTSTASTLFTIATSTNIFNVTTAGGVGVGTTTAGSAWFQVASTSPGLIIDRAGQVGIGTTTLSGLFTVGTSTTGLTVLQNGYVGIGTIAPVSALDVFSAQSPVMRGIRSTSDTVDIRNGAAIQHRTSGDMADGFGVLLEFQIQDNAGNENSIASIGAVRDGADNSGAVTFYTRTGGAGITERMRISTAGLIGISTTSPTEMLTLKATSTNPALGVYASNSTPIIYTNLAGNVAIGTSTASTFFTIATSTNIFNVTTAGGVGVGTTTAGSAWFQVASTSPGFIVDRAGQVGIGTSTPASVLDVWGESNFMGGNMGIGTTTPGYPLHAFSNIPTDTIVADGLAANNVGFAWYAGATQKWAMYRPGNTNDLRLYDSSIDVITFQRGGNIGIATTTPNENLTVWGGAFFGTTSATPTFYIASSTGRVAIGTSTAATLFSVATSTSIFHINQAGQVAIGTSTLSGLFSVATSTYGLFVNSSGQVGIGTTTIAGLLNVGTTTSGFFINQAGNIGIGTTTPNALAHVWGNAAVSALTVQQTGAGNIVDFMSTSTSIFTLASDDRLRYRDGLIQTWGDFQGVILDDFEDNVVTNWMSSDPTNSTTSPSATTTHFKVGDYALGMHTTVNSSKGDTATTSPSTADWSSYERLSYWIMVKNNSTSSLDASTTQQIIDFRFKDSGESTAFNATATIKEIGKWQYQEVDLNATGTTGRDVVSWYGFGITNDYGSPIFYIDQIRVYDSDERTSEVFVDSAGGLNIVSPTRIDLTRGAPGSDSRPGVSIDTAVVEINQPLSVNVGGDVGFDYDLVFMNTGMSNITSEGPLTISAGDNAHYENLTLKTGGTGDIVMDIASSTLGFKITGSATGTFGGYIMRVDPLGAAIEIGRGLVNDIIYLGGSLFPSTTTATTSNATTSAYSLGTSTAVWSAVWALTSHIGDLVFGNMFSITEASKIGIAPPEALVFQNASGTQIMKIDESGELTVDTIKTRQLCVGNTCVTEEQFSAVFGASTSSDATSTPPEEATSTPATSTPETIIDSAVPSSGEATTSLEAVFTFHAEQNGTTTTDSTFQCKLGILDWAGCTSPKTYPGLSVGEYTFQVYATDSLGNYDQSPASSTWTIIE